MTEVDITESQGKLFEWDEKCDWLVDFQDGPFADFTRDVQISVDHASYARFPANPKATQQTIPEADEVITQPCHVHPEYQGYDPGQTAVDYTKTLWTRLIGKHGNYIDYESGKDSLKNIDSLPVFHFLPMNPPTTANADGQHVVCQLTMVNEIDITIKLDMRHPLPRLKNGSAFISINNSFDPRHVVTPIWANSGAKSSGSMINPPSHRWGSAPLEYV
ncbi:hypothetical protein DAPPUDRAFT_299570 [Daphnia pulex]|uniref:Uncharacterized protein n=1 Tax=Daphnia pulex TaxID=6669 RepID=E9I3L9_DAPPU|nr:hypothetical protein DAPPUDRAFT_299570 [Daphnia pulex]|eukprot:EFX61412.1 hypothetical protein DAPPUDRAFT_299570 [Daphnia pulex]